MPLTEGLISRKMCIGPPKQGYAEKRKKKSYAVVLKFNKCHDDKSGKFSSTCGAGGGGEGISHHPELDHIQRSMQEDLHRLSKKPIHKVHTAEEAVEKVLRGERVEIQDTKDVHTVIKRLGELAMEAKAQGKDAVNFDPCTITVKGVSLFCTEKITTEKFPHGIPRVEMPQFKSKTPTPGSRADKLPRDQWGEVDASQEFLKHLEEIGVKAHDATIPAKKLKASQAEMEGVKVAALMTHPERDPKKAKIWVSKDGYVIDGHHTWAAAIGRDAEDGNLDNDKEMEVVVVDMLMSDVYHLSVAWTRKFGLPAQGVKKFDDILMCTSWRNRS